MYVVTLVLCQQKRLALVALGLPYCVQITPITTYR